MDSTEPIRPVVRTIAARRMSVLVGAAIVAVHSACGAETHALTSGSQSSSPAYPTVSTDLIYASNVPADINSIDWLDADRIVIPARAIEHHLTADGQDQPTATPPGVFIVNTKKNTYEHYADLIPANAWNFCFNRGFISYSVQGNELEPSTYVVKAGQIGHEVPVSHEYIRANNGVPGCVSRPRFELEHDGRVVRYVLAPNDGYIVVGPASRFDDASVDGHFQNRDVQLVSLGAAKFVTLPITAYEMGGGCRLSYSDYARKYLLIPNRGPVGLPPTTPMPVYAISPDGKVDKYEIPHGWELGVQAVYMTRRGLFWVTNTTQHAQSLTAGGWLTNDDTSTKLFDEQVAAAGVSPDGCRVVYQAISRHSSVPYTLQIMDLCAGQHQSSAHRAH